MTEPAAFEPDWFSPPGHTIAAKLRKSGISVDSFAWEMDLASPDANRLLDGELEINDQIALKLGQVLGGSQDFWIRREAQYRGDIGRLAAGIDQQQAKEWLRLLPLKDMTDRGWIKAQEGVLEKLTECMRFFDVCSIDAFDARSEKVVSQVKFRTSEKLKSAPHSLAAWLRFGEIQAGRVQCEPWSLEKFCSLIPEMRKLTRVRDTEKFLPKLASMCQSAGVALVICKTPKGCRASGATKFLSDDKAMLLLSFRHLSDDHFWFSFFHECGHLILHGKDKVFVEGEEAESEQHEKEANLFAEDILIPDPWKKLLTVLPMNQKSIQRFAVRVGVSAGIIVGQLEHSGRVRHGYLGYLKRRYRWAD